ncbi:MAG: helix-turn-helix domain-containing protein [Nanoarchaeota archaeon]
MDTQALEDIGLTKTEIKIYLSLLKLGQSTTTGIIREAGIHSSKVYICLDRLIEKGLVSYAIKSNKKHFLASTPESLRNLLKDKEEKIAKQGERIERLIPELEAIKKSGENSIYSETYEGIRGAKSVYEKILQTLNPGQTQYVIGAPKIGNELLEGFLLEWHKRRIKKGIRCKYIYDHNARQYGRIRANMPFTQVKYLPKGIMSPVWIEIFGPYVLIGHIKGRNAILFLIFDSEIAKSYMDYFRMIWKTSRE